MQKILETIGLFTLIIMFLLVCGQSFGKPSSMDLAHYEDEGVIDPLNWEEIAHDNMLLDAVQATVNDDLALALGIDFKFPATVANAKLVNGIVNMKFPYRLDDFNMWRAQRPIETIILHSGDCKALAVYKYHLLKQLGYKNVKVLTIRLPDGRGDIAGHAVVLLDDLWILDINHPYFYNFAGLRADTELYKSYDETGVHLIQHYKDDSDD